MSLGQTIPILRSFDETKAREFYLDYLGFDVDWEHRFEDDLPLYLQISLGSCVLHLSEHHGDCTPGSAVRIAVDDLEAFHDSLRSQSYRNARPGIETMPWGLRELTVTDPFGNRLIFWQTESRSPA
ncbi:MAG: glyoxalase superfamily protein [Pseudomonadota bacterium]